MNEGIVSGGGSMDVDSLLSRLRERCNNASIKMVEPEGELGVLAVVEFKRGRESRDLELWDDEDVEGLLSVPFEGCQFLAGVEAICNYDEGFIEVLLQPLSTVSPMVVLKKIFGVGQQDIKNLVPITVKSSAGVVAELGLASPLFLAVYGGGSMRSITLKLKGLTLKNHDATLEYLNVVSSSLLFQVELIYNVAMIMRRARVLRHLSGDPDFGGSVELKFPDREFDQAPLSLYWYARSAGGMPLLQYLAYYQVIEFYFPIYSHSEAHRKLKSILRNPLFRPDRDSDVSKLLSAIQVGRGGFGDERSQLKATIDACVDEEDLRAFLTVDESRQKFLSGKTKLSANKLSVGSSDSELKVEVSRRVYELRCKIVHTKVDPRDADVELLLPFSKEADLMRHDIELAQYLAQQVLIAGSRPFQ